MYNLFNNTKNIDNLLTDKEVVFKTCSNIVKQEVNNKLMGWIFPFASYMKTYLVKYEYSGWQEVKAFDKMCIRNSWYTNSGIIKIIEI